jgi:hypothetical protein
MTPTDFQIKPAFWLKEEGTRANGGSDEDCAELTKPYQMASYFLRYQSFTGEGAFAPPPRRY